MLSMLLRLLVMVVPTPSLAVGERLVGRACG